MYNEYRNRAEGQLRSDRPMDDDQSFMGSFNEGDKLSAGWEERPWDRLEDVSPEEAEAYIVSFIEEQKARGVKRENLKLPCGEYMVARGFDDANDAEDYEPVFDRQPGSWEWSDQARRENPGLGRVAKGTKKRRYV